MPDQWGRPTMSDGLQIAQAFQWAKRNQEQDQDRRTDQEAMAVADAMAQKKDTSTFSPEARYKGAKLHWDQRFNELKAQTQEHLNSQAGMQEKMQALDMNLKMAQSRLQQYQANRSP